MMIITTSDHAEEVIGNIMEEKNWDLWIHKCCSCGQRYDRMAYQRDSGCSTFISKYF